MKKSRPRPDNAVTLRRRAEARLRAQLDTRGPRVDAKKSGANAHRLLHELQVHQVELEMQNAELQEARDRSESLLEKYTELYDFAPVGYFSLTPGGNVTLVNLTGARLVGIERSRLSGRPLAHYLAAEDRSVFHAFLKRVFAGASRQSCEVTLTGTGGQPRIVGIEAESLPGRRECRAVVMDITDRKQTEATRRRAEALVAANEEANREIARRVAVEKTLRETEQIQARLLAESRELHARLRHVTRQILHAQEEERKKISRELHDEVAQILAGINVQLAALTNCASTDLPDFRKRIGVARRLVGQSITIVHRFARELRPTLLDDLGLVPALRAFIRDLHGRRGLHIDLTVSSGIEGLDSACRTVLFRVAQEALTNIVRHAHAHLATVEIRRTPDAVLLDVRDDGKSFPVERVLTPNTYKRLGLLGMRERVEMVGGTLTIVSKPGSGTTVSAEIPFPHPTRKSKP